GHARHHASRARHRRGHGRSRCAPQSHSPQNSSSRACVAGLRRSAPGPARRRHGAPSRAAASAERAAAQRRAAIARALATPCENTQITPEPTNLESARAAVLCLINHQRAQNGEEPLVVDPRLQSAAEAHVEELISADYFAHVSPSGVTPVDRIRATGYIPGPEFGYLIGENLAWGTLTLSTPQTIVEAWMASPEHRANILEGRYVDTGIGITPSVPASLSGGSPGATYAQEFGTITS
ncbi:MAG TPA: CAP domain-containing protein, partial [Solirubrobacteraceae bacterium]|nr:CAP domain-containing protein [Solirubrobacteraceae bacterium]